MLDTNLWWSPIVNSLILLSTATILFFTMTETPKFLISKGLYENAKQVVHKIYKTDGNQGQANRITRFIGSTSDQKVTKVSIT